MKILLICGDRFWKNKKLIKKEVKKINPDCILEGGQRSSYNTEKSISKDYKEDQDFGADYLGGKVADELGIPHFQCKANWNFYKLAAGPIRNGWQIKFMKITEVLAFHNDINQSKGTKDMIKQAKKKGIKVTLISE